MEIHSHSIVLLKNTFQDNPNKYLVYYDKRWDCRLFLNYKTLDDAKQNIENISNQLQADLRVDKEHIQGNFICNRMHEKYSVPVKENRCYNHSFYEYGISAFPEQLCQSDFVIGDKHYYWMSLDEMAGDARIMQVNGDILEIVASLDIKK